MQRLLQTHRFLRSLNHSNLTFKCNYNNDNKVRVPMYEPIESRPFFKLPPKSGQQKWFPKHMAIQFEKMEARLRSVDLIIEIS